MKKLLLVVLLLSWTGVFAGGTSYSITIKPEDGLAGTASLAFHADGNVTLLVYESISQLNQDSLMVAEDKKETITQAIHQVLNEMLVMKKFDHLPEYRQSTVLAVTSDQVTRSLTTWRYTEQLKTLIEKVNQLLPENRKVTLEIK